MLYGVAFLLVFYLLRKLFFSKKQLPLPPGPKGLPLVGNVADLPPKGGLEWQHWLKHKDLYGPISHVTVFGNTIILIHDLEIATELLDRRGGKYSSRSRMVFAGEMFVPHQPRLMKLGVYSQRHRCGYNERMPFKPYDKVFRAQRKLAGGQIGTNAAVKRFHPAMNLEVRRFLLRTLEKPEQVITHLET